MAISAFIVSATVLILLRELHRRHIRRGTRSARFAVLAAICALGPATLLLVSTEAQAALVPDVGLGSALNYAVLGAETVTNTGGSTLNGSLGISPGSDITGFPPGLVLAPWTTDTTNAAAAQAQSNLSAGYINAAGRPLTGTTTADLGGLNLQPGVYAGPSKGALGLTGTLTLDGAGDPNSVFIFQTDSTLITSSGSVVQLTNGAQGCHIYWQVGSSATLGTGSTFTGTIMALTSITVTNSVTVHGRVLARTGAVTLDNDTFTRPSCASGAPSGGGTPGGGSSVIPSTGSSSRNTLIAATIAVAAGLGASGVARRRSNAHR